MKKLNKLLILGVFVFLLCGCSNKLECIKETDKETNKIILKFKDNLPIKVKWTRDYIYANDDPYIDLKYLEVQTEYGVFDNIPGVEYKIKKNYSDLAIELNIDYNKYPHSVTFYFPFAFSSLEQNQYILESNGYTCK